jgi:hypothetical protein
MCIMCDGASRDEALFHLHSKVLRHGWALQGVESGDPQRASWIYTVGLSSGFGHPELVMVGGLVDDVVPTLNEVAELVRRGSQFEACDEFDVARGRVTFEAVHRRHLDNGLLAFCDEYHDAIGGPPRIQQVLQVVPLSGQLCNGQAPPALLSNPAAVIAGRPNREERRAAARARSRHRYRRAS